MNNNNKGNPFGSDGGLGTPHGHNPRGGHQGGGILGDAFVKRHTARRAINQNEAFTFAGETYNMGESLKKNAQKVKKESKYPIFTEILEIHDKMQSLHASGASFVEQSTMDITESDFMLMPVLLLKMSLKGIAYVLFGALLFFFFDFFYCFYFGGYFNFNLFVPPIFLIVALTHFYVNQYFLASTKQFVIVGEKIPRTSRFYNSIKNIWSAGEFVILLMTMLSIVAFFYKTQITTFITPYMTKLANVAKNPFFSEADKIELFISSFAISWIALCVVELVFKISWKKKFDDKQRSNMRNILLQHNRGLGIDKILRGEI